MSTIKALALLSLIAATFASAPTHAGDGTGTERSNTPVPAFLGPKNAKPAAIIDFYRRPATPSPNPDGGGDPPADPPADPPNNSVTRGFGMGTGGGSTGSGTGGGTGGGTSTGGSSPIGFGAGGGSSPPNCTCTCGGTTATTP